MEKPQKHGGSEVVFMGIKAIHIESLNMGKNRCKTMEKICLSCGKQFVDTKLSFCTECGARLPATLSEQQSTLKQQSVEQKPKNRFLKILYLFFAIASGIICVLAAIVSAAMPANPTKYLIVGGFAMTAWYFYNGSKE
jgi:ribosomal protein L37E